LLLFFEGCLLGWLLAGVSGWRGVGIEARRNHSLFQSKDEPEVSEGQANWGRSFRF
jgi:hypothetical protein